MKNVQSVWSRFLETASNAIVSWGYVEGSIYSAIAINLLFNDIVKSLLAGFAVHFIFIFRVALLHAISRYKLEKRLGPED